MTGCIASVFVCGKWAHNAAGFKIFLFIVFLLKSPNQGTLNHLFQELAVSQVSLLHLYILIVQ